MEVGAANPMANTCVCGIPGCNVHHDILTAAREVYYPGVGPLQRGYGGRLQIIEQIGQLNRMLDPPLVITTGDLARHGAYRGWEHTPMVDKSMQTELMVSEHMTTRVATLNDWHNEVVPLRPGCICHLCGARFTWSSSTSRHRVLTHRGGVYQCQYCRVVFNKEAQLTRHSEIRREKRRCYLEFREQVVAEAHANRDRIIAEAMANDNHARDMDANVMGEELEVEFEAI